MKTEELFDLVAPIAIYHGTDVAFKSKACKAFRKLKLLSKEDFGTAQGFAVDLKEIESLDACNPWAARVYNQLFIKIVQSEVSWDWEYDKSGCRVFVDESNYPWFAGDNYGMFAWYETAELIKERMGV
jgi:hypothetical protein